MALFGFWSRKKNFTVCTAGFNMLCLCQYWYSTLDVWLKTNFTSQPRMVELVERDAGFFSAFTHYSQGLVVIPQDIMTCLTSHKRSLPRSWQRFTYPSESSVKRSNKTLEKDTIYGNLSVLWNVLKSEQVLYSPVFWSQCMHLQRWEERKCQTTAPEQLPVYRMGWQRTSLSPTRSDSSRKSRQTQCCEGSGVTMRVR